MKIMKEWELKNEMNEWKKEKWLEEKINIKK